ncbi:mRNA surveillance protein pelota [Nanoarchaeota archaeon]
MKIIFSDLKKGQVKIKIESLDDLWHLSQLVDEGDSLKGKTFRKIKLGQEEERNQKIIKKPVSLQIEVDKIDFSLYQNTLRIGGKITHGPEDVPRGSHHTFNLEEGTEITIIKKIWYNYQKQKLKQATKTKQKPILIAIFDREDALIALSKQYGYNVLTEIHGQVPKKEKRALVKGNFYQDLIKSLETYLERYKVDHLILAGPAFYKEDLLKLITNQELKKKITLATCSSVKETAINEILRRPEVKEILKQTRFAEETTLIENLLEQIAANGLATYGIRETKKALEAGAIEQLLVSDSLIQDFRKKDKFKELDEIMKKTDQMKGQVHIISSEHEAGKKLKGLGGLAAILRFKLEW